MAQDDEPSDRPLPSSFDTNDLESLAREPSLHKLFRKIREEPLIPLGIALTVIAFTNAAVASRRGDQQKAQRMFRARVAAQSFTVVAMLAGGAYYGNDRQKSAELRKVEQARDAEEKRIRWIRELEIRDEEDKARQRSIEAKRAANRARRAAEKGEISDGGGGMEEEELAADTTRSSSGVLESLGLTTKGKGGKSEQQQGQQQGQHVKDDIDAGPSVAQALAAAEAEGAASKASGRKQNPRSSLSDVAQVVGKKRPPEGGN